MFVSPINRVNYALSYKRSQTSKHVMSFKAHPDFYKLAEKYEVTASSYFRRGPFYGEAHDNFVDVINVLKNVFSKKRTKPVKMLIVGVGESQEPFSILAVIKNIIGQKKLKDVLDLNIIDLQSKPEKEKLFEDSYYHNCWEPEFVPSSFLLDTRFYPKKGYTAKKNYRVNDEIFKYLYSVYENIKKSMWDTRVQDGIKTYKNDNFDVISINNTLGYIVDKNERSDVTKNVCRTLKRNGIYITDPYYNNVKGAKIEKSFREINPGIYKKL